MLYSKKYKNNAELLLESTFMKSVQDYFKSKYGREFKALCDTRSWVDGLRGKQEGINHTLLKDSEFDYYSAASITCDFIMTGVSILTLDQSLKDPYITYTSSKFYNIPIPQQTHLCIVPAMNGNIPLIYSSKVYNTGTTGRFEDDPAINFGQHVPIPLLICGVCQRDKIKGISTVGIIPQNNGTIEYSNINNLEFADIGDYKLLSPVINSDGIFDSGDIIAMITGNEGSENEGPCSSINLEFCPVILAIEQKNIRLDISWSSKEDFDTYCKQLEIKLEDLKTNIIKLGVKENIEILETKISQIQSIWDIDNIIKSYSYINNNQYPNNFMEQHVYRSFQCGGGVVKNMFELEESISKIKIDGQKSFNQLCTNANTITIDDMKDESLMTAEFNLNKINKHIAHKDNIPIMGRIYLITTPDGNIVPTRLVPDFIEKNTMSEILKLSPELRLEESFNKTFTLNDDDISELKMLPFITERNEIVKPSQIRLFSLRFNQEFSHKDPIFNVNDFIVNAFVGKYVTDMEKLVVKPPPDDLNITSVYETSECVICFDKFTHENRPVAINCNPDKQYGHACMCIKCSETLMIRHTFSRCPLCRNTFINKKQMKLI